MTRGVLFFMVLGLATIAGAEPEIKLDGVSPLELKEIEKEIANGNVPPNYAPADKLRRGAKITNTDSPNFNYLTNQTPQKQAQVSQPLRYYQHPYPFYQPPNPYFVQPQAAQIAAQYQYPGISHFLQTPTQIQYVSGPNIQQVPSAKYQSLNSKTPGGVTPPPAAAQYVPAHQQFILPVSQYYPQYTATPAAASGSAATTSTASQVQSAQQFRHPAYYPQQPVVMFLLTPQPQNQQLYMHQQHTPQQHLQYLLNNQLLNLYGQRYQYTYPQQTPQVPVTYLIPMGGVQHHQQTVPAVEGQAAPETQAPEAVKTTSQEVTSSNGAYGQRTQGIK